MTIGSDSCDILCRVIQITLVINIHTQISTILWLLCHENICNASIQISMHTNFHDVFTSITETGYYLLYSSKITVANFNISI